MSDLHGQTGRVAKGANARANGKSCRSRLEAIEARRQKAAIAIDRLTTEASMSHTTYSRLIDGVTKAPRATTLSKLEKALTRLMREARP